MRVSRTRAFRIELGNYEKQDISVSVTVDHLDLGYTDAEWVEGMRDDATADEQERELEAYCLKILDRQMNAELEWARRHCDQKSFLYQESRPSRRGR